MELFKIKFSDICDTTLSQINNYSASLLGTVKMTAIQRKVSHYNFLSELLSTLNDTEKLISELSDMLIQAADKDCEILARNTENLLNLCMAHRQNLKAYFSATEDILKQSDALHKLKNQTNILTRQTLHLKNSLGA